MNLTPGFSALAYRSFVYSKLLCLLQLPNFFQLLKACRLPPYMLIDPLYCLLQSPCPAPIVSKGIFMREMKQGRWPSFTAWIAIFRNLLKAPSWRVLFSSLQMSLVGSCLTADFYATGMQLAAIVSTCLISPTVSSAIPPTNSDQFAGICRIAFLTRYWEGSSIPGSMMPVFKTLYSNKTSLFQKMYVLE